MAPIFILAILFIIGVHSGEFPPTLDNGIAQNHEKKLSQYVMTVLEHYKQTDPIGIPGAPVPDPLSIPPLSHSFSVGTMHFEKVKLFGLSKFRIEYVKADIASMQVEAALTIETLDVLGNYTLSTWLSKAKGPFTVKLTNVTVKAIAKLEVERNGQLEAQDMNMDITFKEIAMNFEGLGFFASMFQSVVNSVGTFLFDSIKPFILSEVNTNIRKDVNEQVRKIPQTFPNSISPFDQLLGEVRHKIRNAKYDPYKVNDYNNSMGLFDVKITHIWLTGLSSVHRHGDIIVEVKNNSVNILVEAGTQQLVGTCNWELALVAGLMTRAGTVTFTVDYFRVEIALNQAMDMSICPKIEDIQLELGNIQLRFDGAGSLDYVIEFLVNVLPNLLRYQIMDALESPLKQRIQDVLNKVNVEQIVKENADKIDNTNALEFF